MRAAVEIADRAYVLDDGSVVYSGAAAEFAKDEERVRALAGASAEDLGAGRRAGLAGGISISFPAFPPNPESPPCGRCLAGSYRLFARLEQPGAAFSRVLAARPR